MIRAIVWGLGKEYNRYFNLLQYHEMTGNLHVVGVTANSNEYAVCGDYQFVPPNSINGNKYDVIIVTSAKNYKGIVENGKKLGISDELFIPVQVLEIPKIDLNKYLRLKRSRLSIISQNCWGGLAYHYLGLQFTSPFINMSVSEDDMLKLMTNLKQYMDYDVRYKTKIYNETLGRYYPVGTIGDVKLNFIHYTDFDEAVNIWEKRKNRINYDNLLFMAYTEDVKFADRFARVGNCKKICFVPFEHQSDCICYLPHREKEKPFWKMVTTSAIGKNYCYDIVDLLLGDEKDNG
ncbi:DUF1919 domain-containing protein [Butyrivibrio sp. AE2032]|uniref:DUF1919 domain-containing protein n=1 Tax=Butyrivibrio sp. AE2032 TaxID=1458463 RepID=UPI000690EA90|nr:DUF1919 domain-containing protein [Butyrivibrio sp. AE2032]